MNKDLTLRETLEQMSGDELMIIMQEHIDWEASGSVQNDSQLRAISLQQYGRDNAIEMDRVAFETFRVYALRAAGMR